MRNGFLLCSLFSLVLALSACEDQPGPAPNPTSGGERTEEDDALEIAGIELPPLPHGVSASRAPLEEGVRLARVSGDLARPALAETATLAEVQAYVAGPLRDWMLLRGRALREVRGALAEAEDGEDGELVVAAGVVGVLYLRFALDLAELPLPTSVREDAAARLGIRNALLSAASPLFDGALSAFGACAASSVGSADPSLEPWERFCDDASIQAQDAPRPIDDGSAEERASEETPTVPETGDAD
jgi:hypothetical protein